MWFFGLVLFAVDAFVLHLLSTEKAFNTLLTLAPSFALYGAAAAAFVFIILVIDSIRIKRKFKRLAAK